MPSSRRRRVRRVVATAVLMVCLSVSGASGAAFVFRPPTEAPVLDPFRPPAGPYGAGNRGIEYNTGDGDLVRAAASGEVVFAGAVAGDLFVSIAHPAGLRSTAGYVKHLLVRAGDQVGAGDVIAVAGGPIHFTVRLDGVYVDPAPLFGSRHEHVRLVPHRRENAPPPAAPAVGPATLSGGPLGPRTVPDRQRRILLVRATPGRLGVLYELVTGKKERSWQSSP